MKKAIYTLIIDDEPLAVKLMADYASKVPHLKVLYAGSDVFQAIDLLNRVQVDLIFIDIQMPQLTGIELMQMFHEKHHYIITSAYPEYALDAFRFHVVDFLLKPVTFQRFYQSITKYHHWLESIQHPDEEPALLIRADRKDYKVFLKSILYIEGLRDYVVIHTETDKIMALENMKDLLAQLPAHQFVRIHRSYIIPISRVAVIEPHQIRLDKGTTVPVGETYRKTVHDLLTRVAR